MADQFSKSATYCYNWSTDSNTMFMLVCQVALGSQKEVEQPTFAERPPAGCDSVFAPGRNRPDGRQDVMLPSGEWNKL